MWESKNDNYDDGEEETKRVQDRQSKREREKTREDERISAYMIVNNA